MDQRPFLTVSKHVSDAISAGSAVVALESTLITHGLPRPEGLAAGLRLEQVVREAGALPATVGVIAGRLVVGLSETELAQLANANADKASLWNLAAICAAGGSAGTTVATTLMAAAVAGIAVFATGGIGGVHEAPFDESADLTALARYPVLTVCAGPKSILDAAATLERLETLGVPVVGYRSRHLAGFLVAETSLSLPTTVSTPGQAAALALTQRQLGLPQAVLVSNPVSGGMASDRFAELLESARRELEAAEVHGPATTPFLLAALARLSSGETVKVNGRLLEQNARLAGQIAVALAGLGRKSATARNMTSRADPAADRGPGQAELRTGHTEPSPGHVKPSLGHAEPTLGERNR